MAVPACASCGLPIVHYGEVGPIIAMSDAHVYGLKNLLAKAVDSLRCESCGKDLPLWPTVAVWFDDFALIELAPGSQALTNRPAVVAYFENMQLLVTDTGSINVR